jgi:hypothetical protein
MTKMFSHVVGARPNFKVTTVMHALEAYACRHVLVHTRHHYDPKMSGSFLQNG